MRCQRSNLNARFNFAGEQAREENSPGVQIFTGVRSRTIKDPALAERYTPPSLLFSAFPLVAVALSSNQAIRDPSLVRHLARRPAAYASTPWISILKRRRLPPKTQSRWCRLRPTPAETRGSSSSRPSSQSGSPELVPKTMAPRSSLHRGDPNRLARSPSGANPTSLYPP